MELLKPGVAGFSVLAACLAVQHASATAEWRSRNTELIQEAVLLDMLCDDFRWGFSGHPSPLPTDRVACVGYRAPSVARGGVRDPSAAVLARLQSLGRPVVPASQCMSSDHGLTDRGTGRRAMLLTVHSPRWIEEAFVKVEGEWLVGPLYAAGSEYSVSLSNGTWSVDSVKFTWVADCADEAHAADKRRANRSARS